ncbi:MAG TPA: MFS transporter [Fimbriimonadaceae bacterium]|nr:MFS transporter [Fimbriimonadaceae bacterium]
MSEPPETQPKIPPTVWRLGWVSFFADVSSEMVYPLIPAFLNGVLRAPAQALGIVEGVAEGIVSVMKGWSGIHTDRKGERLPTVKLGYTLSAIGKPLLAVATVWPVVLLGRGVDRLGKGIRGTARDALLTDVIPPGIRGRAFGLHRALDTAGALVGVLIAAMLMLAMPGAYRTVFVLAAVPGFLAVALLFTVREREPPPAANAANRQKVPWRTFPRAFWVMVGLSLLFGLANSSDTFLLLRASELGLSEAQVVGTYALYNVMYMLVSYPAGILSDRLGRWLMIGLGWALYAAVYGGFAFTGPGGLIPLFALYGVYIGLTKGVSVALVADHAPKEWRGSAMGIYFMTSGGVTLAANAVTGVLWDRVGYQAALLTCAGIAAVAVLGIPLALRTRRNPD